MKPPIVLFVILLFTAFSCQDTEDKTSIEATGPYYKSEILFEDNFDNDLADWAVELEDGGDVKIIDGELDIDVSSGCSVWFNKKLSGKIMIQYQARVISAGGDNDNLTDLNCFWMASLPDSDDDVPGHFSGDFTEYDILKTYYVGYGGNLNTTTRFRRYEGNGEKPLLPENDLSDEEHLIKANRTYTIKLVAFDDLIQYIMDDKVVFEYEDSSPYSEGWFALRTVSNHMKIDNFKIYRLEN